MEYMELERERYSGVRHFTPIFLQNLFLIIALSANLVSKLSILSINFREKIYSNVIYFYFFIEFEVLLKFLYMYIWLKILNTTTKLNLFIFDFFSGFFGVSFPSPFRMIIRPMSMSNSCNFCNCLGCKRFYSNFLGCQPISVSSSYSYSHNLYRILDRQQFDNNCSSDGHSSSNRLLRLHLCRYSFHNCNFHSDCLCCMYNLAMTLDLKSTRINWNVKKNLANFTYFGKCKPFCMFVCLEYWQNLMKKIHVSKALNLQIEGKLVY